MFHIIQICTFVGVNQDFKCHLSLRPDSIGTKFGGKPGGKPGSKKPFKPYNNTEKKSRPGKGRDGGKKEQKFAFSKAGMGQKKRKLSSANDGEEGGGEKTSACGSLSLQKLSHHNVNLFSMFQNRPRG